MSFIRRRGGSSFRPSRLRDNQPLEGLEVRRYPHGHPGGFDIHPPKVSHTAVVLGMAQAYCEVAEVEETREDHIVPRESITTKQHLRLFPVVLELEALKPPMRITLQLDKMTGKTVEVADPILNQDGSPKANNRLLWKSEKTLLRRGIPQDNKRFDRVTSVTKRRDYNVDENFAPAVVEVEELDMQYDPLTNKDLQEDPLETHTGFRPVGRK